MMRLLTRSCQKAKLNARTEMICNYEALNERQYKKETQETKHRKVTRSLQDTSTRVSQVSRRNDTSFLASFFSHYD